MVSGYVTCEGKGEKAAPKPQTTSSSKVVKGGGKKK